MFFVFFYDFPAHGKTGLKWPQMKPGNVVPSNPDLADILADTDFDFENLHFLYFWIPRFLDFQIPRLSARDSQSILRDGSAVAPRWLWTTKLVKTRILFRE